MNKNIKNISTFIIFAPVVFIAFSIVASLIYELKFGHSHMILYLQIIALFMVLIITKQIAKKIEEYKKVANINENELKEKNSALKYQLYTDDLTKLLNFKSFNKDILKIQNPKVIVLDIDSFKDINEFYGKENGDIVLLEISNMIKEFAQKNKMKAYRVGSDEFAILDGGDLSISKYESIAVELVEEFKTKEIQIDKFNTSVVVNATIGFSLESEDSFIKAHIALTHAKNMQKDFACYIQDMDTKDEYADRLKYIKLIKNALDKDNVLPYYQPILNRDKKILKYECLSRVKDDDGKVISPGFFMGPSKKVRLYSLMAKKIIDASFREISKTDKSISINLLPRDMMDNDISNYVVDKLKEYKIAKQVVFEILEDESIEHLERVSNFIDKVKRMGVRIAIDDFGTGYSNFSYLLKLKPDYLKIDGSIIKNIDIDKNSQAIVKAIISFAKTLDIKTIAEFVHSKDVYDKCFELGIDEFQGYYLGEPAPDLV